MTIFINSSTPPSGPGCVECERVEGWWYHLRRCAECGHVGCCDSSIGKHATAHFREAGHAVMQSFEPGEDWFWDYQQEVAFEGATLAAPTSHPRQQTTPGPAERVPKNWMQLID